MAKFTITYGLNGGFNTETEEIIDVDSIADANQHAWELACNEYDQFAGGNGLRDTTEIMIEDDVDEIEAEEIFNEEREGWLNYSAEPLMTLVANVLV